MPDTELGKMIRGAFIAEEGGKLIVADYSQVELVYLAHYLGSGKLYDGFLAGIDRIPRHLSCWTSLGKYAKKLILPYCMVLV